MKRHPENSSSRDEPEGESPAQQRLAAELQSARQEALLRRSKATHLPCYLCIWGSARPGLIVTSKATRTEQKPRNETSRRQTQRSHPPAPRRRLTKGWPKLLRLPRQTPSSPAAFSKGTLPSRFIYLEEPPQQQAPATGEAAAGKPQPQGRLPPGRAEGKRRQTRRGRSPATGREPAAAGPGARACAPGDGQPAALPAANQTRWPPPHRPHCPAAARGRPANLRAVPGKSHAAAPGAPRTRSRGPPWQTAAARHARRRPPLPPAPGPAAPSPGTSAIGGGGVGLPSRSPATAAPPDRKTARRRRRRRRVPPATARSPPERAAAHRAMRLRDTPAAGRTRRQTGPPPAGRAGALRRALPAGSCSPVREAARLAPPRRGAGSQRAAPVGVRGRRSSPYRFLEFLRSTVTARGSGAAPAAALPPARSRRGGTDLPRHRVQPPAPRPLRAAPLPLDPRTPPGVGTPPPPWAAAPGPDAPLCEDTFPTVPPEPPLAQPGAVSSHPVACAVTDPRETPR